MIFFIYVDYFSYILNNFDQIFSKKMLTTVSYSN